MPQGQVGTSLIYSKNQCLRPLGYCAHIDEGIGHNFLVRRYTKGSSLMGCSPRWRCEMDPKKILLVFCQVEFVSKSLIKERFVLVNIKYLFLNTCRHAFPFSKEGSHFTNFDLSSILQSMKSN